MARPNATQIQALVDHINQAHSRDFTLIGKMERGVNGAWLVRSADGVQHILKHVKPDDVTAQIRCSAICASHINAPSSPTPQYELVGYNEEIGSWYVQEFLPGIPAPWPSRELVDQLISLNSRQSGAAVTNSVVDWSQVIRTTLFGDEQLWQKNISASGVDGQGLVDSVYELVRDYENFQGVSSDIVHGDFQHYNALVEGDNDKLTGYVDWEGAGSGDRAIDLSRLLYDVYVAEPELNYPADPATIAVLRQEIEKISGRAGLVAYMAYWILQVADFGVKCGPEHAMKFFKVGHRILTDLRS
jgi:hypothetical protein